MHRLYLLRHAKSDWSNIRLSDFDRPLNARGRRSADAVGQYLAQGAYALDLIISSSAQRTRETVARVLEASGLDVPVRFDDGLYLAAPQTLLDILAEVAADAEHVMLVGHNPGMHALGMMLAGSGDRELLDDLHAKFPTGALLDLDLGGLPVSDIRPGAATVRRFIKPKALLRGTDQA